MLDLRHVTDTDTAFGHSTVYNISLKQTRSKVQMWESTRDRKGNKPYIAIPTKPFRGTTPQMIPKITAMICRNQ